MQQSFYGLKVEVYFVEGGLQAIEYPHPNDFSKVYIESLENQPYYLQFTNERSTPIEVVISLDGLSPISPYNERAQIHDEGIRIEPKGTTRYRASNFSFPVEFSCQKSDKPCPGSIGFAFWHIREDGTRGITPMWMPVFRYESRAQLKELGISVLEPELAHRENSQPFASYLRN